MPQLNNKNIMMLIENVILFNLFVLFNLFIGKV